VVVNSLSDKRIINLIEKVAKDNSVILQSEVTLEIGAQTARNTRVDTGKATANWTTSVGSPDLSDTIKFDKSASAGPTIAEQRNGLKKLKFGETAYLANAVTGAGRDKESPSTFQDADSKYIGELEMMDNMFQKATGQAKNIVNRLTR